MSLKQFRKAHDASRYFNKANGHWREAKQDVLEGKQRSANESLAEVIRYCQLAIEADERIGDAYILLANALMNLANQVSEQTETSEFEFLLSRAAAVIHLWHSLPYRRYPISKNWEIGEQLWTKAIQKLRHDKSLSETTALSLLGSYRDNLATDIVSPRSFEEIEVIILGTESKEETAHTWLKEPLEETLSSETRYFITKILPEVIQRRAVKEQGPENRLSKREGLVDSLKYEGKISIANIEISERIQKAFHKSDFREVVGWMWWLFLLIELREMIMLDSDSKGKLMTEQGEFFGGLLNTAVHQARQAEDLFGLLMAVGLYDFIGVSEKRDEIFRFVYKRIDNKGIESRLHEIQSRPQMLIEDTIVNRIRRCLRVIEN